LESSTLAPVALSVADAVRYTGLSRSRLYELVRDGQIASFQVGGRRMFLRSALDAFFAKLAKVA
jgi:excisionase family DNA binding protein